MDLVLEVRTGRERVTMACHGKLVGGKEAEAFRRSAMLLMGGFDHMTINLAGVRSVDCGGLGCLAGVLDKAIKLGKRVRITHASLMVETVLQLCGMEGFLHHNGVSLPEGVRPRLVATATREAVA
jgi:anti-anti-sigma factor